ncbi:MAG: hypothetical protein ACREJR_06510, partial [Candidatus Rokuibacteriota bacterium]
LMAVAMRHLSDPVPSVRERRPEVSGRVEAVVARALAKRPADRFPSMDALVAALEACLAELGPEAAGSVPDDDTGVIPPAPAPARSRPVPQPRRQRRRGLGFLAAVLGAVVALLAGGLVAIELLLDDGGPGILGVGGSPDGEDGEGGSAVQLRAVSDFDPDGDDVEHPEDVPAATDGDRATFWTTETYQSFSKPGVGIVLDAGEPLALSRLVVTSDEAGFTAVVMAGEGPEGPFEEVSESQQAGRRTSFALDVPDEGRRYYLLWITSLAGRAHVNEVRAFSG